MGSWNVGGLPPPSEGKAQLNIKDWLFPFNENFLPDLMVIGFQEIVDLNPHSVLIGNNSSRVREWVEYLLFHLNSLSQDEPDYFEIASESLVGVHLSVFTRKTKSNRITDVASTKIKLGFGGNMGNKGATLVRFNFDDTSMCFANCHLESGMSEDLTIKRAL